VHFHEILKGFNDPFRAREKTFTVFFYGLKNFWCKIAQFSATRRECEMPKIPSVGNGAQVDEKLRKNSSLN
jgi:hypothetical protein